jgi:hypothetical protein
LATLSARNGWEFGKKCQNAVGNGGVLIWGVFAYQVVRIFLAESAEGRKIWPRTHTDGHRRERALMVRFGERGGDDFLSSYFGTIARIAGAVGFIGFDLSERLGRRRIFIAFF